MPAAPRPQQARGPLEKAEETAGALFSNSMGGARPPPSATTPMPPTHSAQYPGDLSQPLLPRPLASGSEDLKLSPLKGLTLNPCDVSWMVSGLFSVTSAPGDQAPLVSAAPGRIYLCACFLYLMQGGQVSERPGKPR